MTTPPTAAGITACPEESPRAFHRRHHRRRSDTFASVAAHPKWFGMLALTTVIIAIFTRAAADDARPDARPAIDQQVEQMKSFGMTVNDEMYEQMEKGSGRMPYTTGISMLVVVADRRGHHRGDPVRHLQRGDGRRGLVQAGLQRSGRTPVRSRRSRRCCLGHHQLLPAGPTGSVANLGALLPMLPENSFAAHLLGMVDVFLIWYIVVLAIGLARAVPPAHAADRDLAAVGLRGDRHRHRARQEPGWGSMSRNKKILIGLGIVVVLGGDRVRQRQVQAGGRRRRQRRSGPEAGSAGDRVRVGQDPAAAPGQHQRRHDGQGDGPDGRGRPARAEGGVPPADRSAQPDDGLQPDDGVARGGALADGAAARVDRQHQDRR